MGGVGNEVTTDRIGSLPLRDVREEKKDALVTGERCGHTANTTRRTAMIEHSDFLLSALSSL
jgi:hypothetical protein